MPPAADPSAAPSPAAARAPAGPSGALQAVPPRILVLPGARRGARRARVGGQEDAAPRPPLPAAYVERLQNLVGGHVVPHITPFEIFAAGFDLGHTDGHGVGIRMLAAVAHRATSPADLAAQLFRLAQAWAVDGPAPPLPLPDTDADEP